MAGWALTTAVLALVAAAFSAWYARDTSVSTKRQAIAAEAQAEYARRSLELAEKQASMAFAERERDVGDGRLGPRTVEAPSPWLVTPLSRYKFLVTNGSDRRLFDVGLAVDVDAAQVQPPTREEVDAYASVRFSMVRAAGGAPQTVTVRWRDQPDGEPREWTTALPR